MQRDYPTAVAPTLTIAGWLRSWANGLIHNQGGETIHDALYKAYFVDGRNIGDIDVLVDIAQSFGLDAQSAREVLITRRFKDSVDADWVNSRAIGVTGVPTFVCGQSGVVGAQPYEILTQLLVNCGAEPRSMNGIE